MIDPLHAGYRSTALRYPKLPLVPAPASAALPGPGPVVASLLGPSPDLTTNTARAGGEAIGERIIILGRIVDEAGTPVADSTVEVWQANAAGRYAHPADDHPAPLDPNFTGAGRCRTDGDGHFRLVTVRPGAYPWGNHENAWRPGHVHFSFFGRSLAGRLVTQMYFPGDPLQELDPILGSVGDAGDRQRLVAEYAHDVTEPGVALGYRWQIVLPEAAGAGGRLAPTPSQTVGPFFHVGLVAPELQDLVDPAHPEAIVLRGRLLDGDGEPVPDGMVELWQPGPDGTFPTDASGELRGWGRSATDAEGRWSFRTLRPGPVAIDGHVRIAPCFHLTVFARGILLHLNTRAYLPGSGAPDDLNEAVRASMTATRAEGEPQTFEIDVVLQGPRQSVFLQI